MATGTLKSRVADTLMSNLTRYIEIYEYEQYKLSALMRTQDRAFYPTLRLQFQHRIFSEVGTDISQKLGESYDEVIAVLQEMNLPDLLLQIFSKKSII